MKPKTIISILYSLLGFVIPFITILITCLGTLVGFKIISVYFATMISGVILLSFIRNKTAFTLLFIVLSCLYSISAFTDVSYFATFNTRITLSTIYIMLETNLNESKEFLYMYIKPWILILLLIFLVSTILSSLTIIKRYAHLEELNKFIRNYKLSALLVTLILIVGSVLLRNYFAFYVTVNGATIFHKEKEELVQLEISPKGNFKSVSHESSNDNEYYIVIIGEATTSTHMGLYGYYRQTNPLLIKRRNELQVYKNVRPPFTYTIGSLSRALTLGNYNSPAKMYNSSLIQLFNSADFHTYFISNQTPIGQYETAVSLTSKVSDKSIYTNIHEPKPDSIIIEPLKKALKDNRKKKFIIVHLMGTHVNYKKRYPVSFNHFTSTPNTIFKHELAYKTINEYDNAVLYNDYIVDQIIDLVDITDSKSFVLYFSDHGEDVYETINEARHAESGGTEPMYKIPFILWRSEQYIQSKNNLYFDENRPYNLKDVIHTIAELSSISFERFNPQKSIVNHQFIDIAH